MDIKSLSAINFETIFEGYSKAFADYDIVLNANALKTMLKRRGFSPELSFAAFDGEEIVAFTFNGTGKFNGVNMAYDTGTATVPAYRGQGLATQIFNHSIPYIKAAGIDYYLLEVLQHNTKAVALYQKIGFEVTRELNYFVWENSALKNDLKPTSDLFAIEPLDISKHSSVADFWDFYPSWQNSFESIERTSADFISLGAFANSKLVGYCVFEPNSGDITQIAVDKAYRRKGIGSLLLHEISRLNRHTKMKLINTDVTCTSIVEFLKAKNIGLTGKQFEMVKSL